MMNRTILKSVIADNQLEVPKYKVIPRNFNFEEFGNYVFVGIRRAGKSFLLYQRMQQLLSLGMGWDEMLYINFEDERLVGMCVNDLNLLLEIHLEMYGKRPILFLDEIQNITSQVGISLHVVWQTLNIEYTSPAVMQKCLAEMYRLLSVDDI